MKKFNLLIKSSKMGYEKKKLKNPVKFMQLSKLKCSTDITMYRHM